MSRKRKLLLRLGGSGQGGEQPDGILVPNQVLSRETFLPFTVGTNTWQGRGFPFKNALGQWGFVWVEATQHSGGTVSEWRTNMVFSNDEGATWTDNNEYIGGGTVGNFPLAAQAAGSSYINECQVILCSNGDLVLLAFDRTSSYTNVSWSQWRSVDNGANWTFQFDFCDQLDGILANNKIQGVYDHLVVGTTVYISMFEFDADINDTRIILYKSEDNMNTFDLVSNVVEYDEANPDCTESDVANLGNGRFIAIMRTQDLGGGVKKISTDSGVTWGAIADIKAALGYTGIHQPHVQKFSNFLLLSGRDCKRDIEDPASVQFRRNSFWVSTDEFATSTRRYLDPFYAGDEGTGVNSGDAGYAKFLVKEDGSFMFFGYYGIGNASMIYKYNVSHTDTPAIEDYANNYFLPETITPNGIRLQCNRDNVKVTSASPALGGDAVIQYAHNTLVTGDIIWDVGGTAPEFVSIDGKGWIILNGGRLISQVSLGNTLFRDSFSVGFWLWPDDGQPAATSILFRDSSLTITTLDDRVQIFLFTDGRIHASYGESGAQGIAITENAIFANGAVATPKHIAVTYTNGGSIRIYVDGVLQGYSGASVGDISALTMANYTTTNFTHFGQRQTGASTFDLSLAAKVREIICQPVVWSAGDIANLMLN